MLGREHPDTLASMNNLAIVLDRQGKYSETEQMHRQTLELNLALPAASSAIWCCQVGLTLWGSGAFSVSGHHTNFVGGRMDILSGICGYPDTLRGILYYRVASPSCSPCGKPGGPACLPHGSAAAARPPNRGLAS